MEEPRTHYQISLTARQAVGLFAGLIVALGLAFFFGLMTGLSGRDRPLPEAAAETPRNADDIPSDPMPPVETAVPTLAASGPSRTELAGGGPRAPLLTTPGPPSTLQPFEDGTAEETEPAPSATAKQPPAEEPPMARGTKRGGFWVQVASLRSREEANALAIRLTKRGFPAQILSAGAPAGRVFRVRVGPYRSREEAGRISGALTRREGVQNPWIVPDGQ